MRQWKKSMVYLCMIGMFAGLLTGCGRKEVISKKTFADTLTSYDYQVKDQSKMIEEGSDLKTVYLAIPKETKDKETEKTEQSFQAQNQIEFYEFTDEKAGKEHFKELSNELVAAYKNEDGYETDTKDAKNAEVRVVETKEQYYKLSRIDDTLVVGIAPKDQQKTIEKIFQELGY